MITTSKIKEGLLNHHQDLLNNLQNQTERLGVKGDETNQRLDATDHGIQ
jgi:hypothetical protein